MSGSVSAQEQYCRQSLVTYIGCATPLQSQQEANDIRYQDRSPYGVERHDPILPTLCGINLPGWLREEDSNHHQSKTTDGKVDVETPTPRDPLRRDKDVSKLATIASSADMGVPTISKGPSKQRTGDTRDTVDATY